MTTPNPLSPTGHNRGDVVLVPFPNSDLRTAKLRPAVIVQANDLDTGISQVIIAMVSSNLARAGHPSRILIETSTNMGTKSGLLFDSVLMCDNLATVTLTAITRKIGSISGLSEIDDALRKTLGL